MFFALYVFSRSLQNLISFFSPTAFIHTHLGSLGLGQHHQSEQWVYSTLCHRWFIAVGCCSISELGLMLMMGTEHCSFRASWGWLHSMEFEMKALMLVCWRVIRLGGWGVWNLSEVYILLCWFYWAWMGLFRDLDVGIENQSFQFLCACWYIALEAWLPVDISHKLSGS